MAEIKDDGKVWIRGQSGTAYAVRVDEKVFVPGREEGQSIETWLEGDFLCVDLHHPDREIRIARRFPLNLEATHPAALFNGFKKTKHADVRVVSFKDDGVAEKVFKGDDYLQEDIQGLNRETFWRKAGLSR